jgi:hypothetical protein
MSTLRVLTRHRTTSVLLSALRRRLFLIAALVALSTVSVVLVPHRSSVTYRAVATIELRRTGSGPNIQLVMEHRLKSVIQRSRGKFSPDVRVTAQPGKQRVAVTADAGTDRMAMESANNNAADLLSQDIGIDREAILEQRKRLRARLNRNPPSGTRARLEAEIGRLAKRQVSDADFASAKTVSRVGKSNRATELLLAASIGLLIALATIIVLERLSSRPEDVAAAR